MPRRPTLIALVLTLIAADARAADAGVEFFENKVRPVFAEHCASCHSAKLKKVRAGLSLDTRAEILKGGESGPSVVAGKPDESLLVKAVRHAGELKMPQKQKLDAKVIADLEKWVSMGAPAPDAKAEVVVAGIDWKKAREFWSFRPVTRPAVPDVAGDAKNPIDRFLLASLKAKSLTPVGPADRVAFARRATLDLTGLPPTPEEVEAFANDRRPDAERRLVDRLLASPAYGERWGRYWLDVARYAEDQAHTFGVKPNSGAYRYRDWVVGALNDDMPYDRFVKLQIAADLLPDAGATDRAALGFFGLGAQYYKNTDAARATADELDDRVDTLARGFLGLTVSCARCHDHKYDPIPTQDYYSLAGVFHSSKLADVPLVSKDEAEKFNAMQAKLAAAEKALKDLTRAEKIRLARAAMDKPAETLTAAWKLRAKITTEAEVAKQGLSADRVGRMATLLATKPKNQQNVPMLEAVRKAPPRGAKDLPAETKAAVAELAKTLEKIRDKKPESLRGVEKTVFETFLAETSPFAPADDKLADAVEPATREKLVGMRRTVTDLTRTMPPKPDTAHGIGENGSSDLPVYIRGNPATKGVVAPRRFLKVLSSDDPAKFTKGSGRLELSSAIASEANPLTARVIVNRLWAHHFGKGLVGTPSNFGFLGERPTHPELLDWLAAELVSSGWSLKHIHRLIVTSAAYGRSSAATDEGMLHDPDNTLLWRMNRRRLDVESWRDGMLAASGELDRRLGGPTVSLDDGGNKRRTVYAKVSRHELNGLLRLFDFPDANITSEKRTETTVPQQQLFVLNSSFVLDRARAMAGRVATMKDDAARVEALYRVVYGRSATAEEREVGTAFLGGKDDGEEIGKNRLTRLERYAQALLAGNEFLYVD